MKQLFEKFNYTFLHNFPYMVNSYVFSLDIPVMINILYVMIKVLHEKMLMQYICIDSIHNDTLAGNNLLNGHSNEP